MLRAFTLALSLALVGLWAPRVQALTLADAAAAKAAKAFARGQALYAKGDFRAAIAAFEEAQRANKHHSNLFNVARCYENLGETANAISYYKRSLAGAPARLRSNIEARLRRLERTPTKLFVSSQPSGAKVTVDGRAKAESGVTPAVLRLTPGEHVLLVRHEGYLLSAKRVVVVAGKPGTVEVKLAPLPKGGAAARCPKPPAPMVDARKLHLHVGAGGSVGFTKGRPLAAGLGLRGAATLRNLHFGVQIDLFPVGEEQVNINGIRQGDVYNKAQYRWVLLQLEGGYVFAWPNATVTALGGIGVSYDRVSFSGDPNPNNNNARPDGLVREAFAFAWSLGGVLDGWITDWLSASVSLRAGAIHGKRVDTDTNQQGGTSSSGSFPFVSLLGAINFHL